MSHATIPGNAITRIGSMYADESGWNSRSSISCGPKLTIPGRKRVTLRSQSVL